ncbi:hypothetical protein [Castellaniella defragrans]|uniref:hypothetical protein n=1 Tax=Castellaniella defragrans TaxID=75697 RepID=UPI0018E0B606|nr:hypothetical protein [Castellaniella defragrans]
MNWWLPCPPLQEVQVLEALTVLVGTSAAAPCQSEAAARQVHKRCDALNRHLIERAQFPNDVEVLASPVLGGGGRCADSSSCSCWLGPKARKNAQEWAQHAWRIIERRVSASSREGKTLESPRR